MRKIFVRLFVYIRARARLHGKGVRVDKLLINFYEFVYSLVVVVFIEII